MATRLRLLLADTHLPKRARDLPAEVWQAVEEADVVVHAGDWVDVALLDELERAPTGSWVLRQQRPRRAARRLPRWRGRGRGLRLGVVHETGPTKGRRSAAPAPRRPRRAGLRARHIPWDTMAATGLRLLNPGSPTDRRGSRTAPTLTATAEDGELTTSCCRLPPRMGGGGAPPSGLTAHASPAMSPAPATTSAAEGQSPGPTAGAVEVVAYVVHPEQLVVGEPLHQVEAAPPGQQPAHMEAPARWQPAWRPARG